MNHRTDPIPPHLAPQRGELIMFENSRLLERLSRIRPATVLTVFLPLVAAAFYLSLASGRTALASAALFLAGAAFWTLFEYFFHRFIFHFEPESAFQTRLQFVMHGVHHQYPQDKDRLVMPITVSIPLAFLLLALFHLLMGTSAWGFFSGFLAGYLAYDMMHYAIHHAKGFDSPLLSKIRRHHLAHHFRDTRRGFGVSSPFWDAVFRT
jgi:sterol desaturase/sphingolipid hydroxylase (fatty acid hydroxylase superfamily)